MHAAASTLTMHGVVFATDALGAVSLDMGGEWIKAGLVKPGVPMEVRRRLRHAKARVRKKVAMRQEAEEREMVGE